MGNNVRKRIGQRIVDIRSKRGITQEQLSELTNFSQSHISRIETGKYNATLETLEIIAKALNVRVDFVDD